MIGATVDAIKSVLRTDPTIDPGTRGQIIQALQAAGDSKTKVLSEGPRLIRRGEVAKRLSLSLRSIDKLHSQGILHKVKLPGRGRAAGFRLSDVEALIGGAQ
jgi:predicted DNA-binding transcriptional regulator AlpA